MKIFFPKYGPGALLIKERGACIISSVIIGFFAGLCVSYFLENNFWLLTVALVGIAGILLWLGGAAGIFLNWSKVDGAQSTNSAASANIKGNLPRITSQWDYRPKRPIRAPAVFDSPGAETSEVLSPDPFGINNNVWLNNGALERTAHAFMNLDPTVEDATTEAPLPDHERPVSVYD